MIIEGIQYDNERVVEYEYFISYSSFFASSKVSKKYPVSHLSVQPSTDVYKRQL